MLSCRMTRHQQLLMAISASHHEKGIKVRVASLVGVASVDVSCRPCQSWIGMVDLVKTSVSF